ncbi:MAG: substrate-binding domain-containing protein, partial [Flavobacteriaceae bacterium]
MRYLSNISLFFLISTFFSCNPENTATIRIGFSQCSIDNNWRKDMNYSMQVQAGIYPNVRLSIYNSEQDPLKQIEDIERMIKDKMDIIIVSPFEPDLIIDVIGKAKDLGIPVILLDRKINSTNYRAYLGADNIEVGRNAGNYITSSTKQDINIVEIRGNGISTPAIERSLGFHQIIDTISRVHMIRSLRVLETGFPQKAFEHILDSLKGDPIDYVYAYNDNVAVHAWEIARTKGLENQIKFIGVDGLDGPDGGIQMVQDGILEATILYPTGGYEVIKLAIQILKGEKIPKNNLLTTTVIDKFNAQIMRHQLEKIDQQQIELENLTLDIKIQKQQYASKDFFFKISITLLVIVFGLAVYGIYSFLTIRKKKKQLELTNTKITVQRNQIEKIANEAKVNNEAKINFFTSLSHEFKTPITLILSSIESIGDITKEKGLKIKNEVALIYNNSNRLLRLINQLLDIRKTENHKFIV